MHFIEAKKREFILKEFIKNELGKGKISNVELERTPLGERIIIQTVRPSIIIGRRGENIQRITSVLKERFKLENPQIEVFEIEKPEYDAQHIADNIANSLERFGPLRFKSIAYKMLQQIQHAGALGAELRLSGKLPGERARSWRFAFGYLKKTGEPAELFVNKAYATGNTRPGSVGIKVFIVPPTNDIREIREKEIPEIIVEDISETTEGKQEIKEVQKTEADANASIAKEEKQPKVIKAKQTKEKKLKKEK